LSAPLRKPALEGADGQIVSLPPLTAEDRVRSVDRGRVFQARVKGRRFYLLWLLTGPGVLAMLGENDGPSMISYAAAGAKFGDGFFLPFILLTFAMAYVCQEMCMRVGAVTHRGYGQLVIERFGPLWGWFAAGDLLITNLVTLIAEFVAIRIGLAYFHLGSGVAAALGVVMVGLTISGGKYRSWERVVLGMAVFNALFLVAAILVKPHVSTLAHGFLTASPFPSGSINTILLLVASTIGATVTPWMIFFQQSASADKGMTPADVRAGRTDTLVGAGLAAIFGCGALIAGAALLLHGGPGVGGVGFPAALGHVSGHAVGVVFALGLIEAGGVAILTISASTGYAIAECVGVPHSFNSHSRSSLLFYLVNLGAAAVAGAVILIPGVPLLSIALNANVLATVLLPVALIFLLILANDSELMGEMVNSARGNAIAVAIVVFIALAGSAYAIDSFLRTVHVIG
jgi:Mn2+/Fe2+ NRAMP family transporter